MKRIIAVVVTYNRKDLLQQCLGAIAAQSRACDAIVVVDNGSSDGTAQLLADTWGQQVQVFVLSRNIGSAGGFSAAFRIAYAQNADLIWAMDDDVLPAPDALQKLLDAETLLDARGIDRAFVCSVAWTPEGDVTNVPTVDPRRNRVHYMNWPFLLEQGLVPVSRSTFVSFLMPRAVVARYGLPLAQMFIWGEDTEYTYRITQHCPGFVVGNSKAIHVRSMSGLLSILTETNPVRLGYHRYHVRNHLYIARQRLGWRGWVRTVLTDHRRTVVHLLLRGDWMRARVVLGGVFDSLGFRPVVEPAESPLTNLGVDVVRPAVP